MSMGCLTDDLGFDDAPEDAAANPPPGAPVVDENEARAGDSAS